ncbi:MAG: RIP metalloprotease RseP [Candidatus Omnitrophica bacterium]|nr:RIP metalloprotease RseP [Candidatus Omnitrophota bacterium]
MNSWFAFLVTLSLIILVHEWGHFAVARWIGVKVERFSFGFGPRLLTWTKRGTEYALSLLPFGGYVKLAGESPEAGGPVHPWEYRGRTIGERMCIVLAGPAINYLLGFLLFIVVFIAGFPVPTPRIGRVLQDYPAAAADLRPGDSVLSVNGKPVETWEEMTRLIQAQTEPVTLQIRRDQELFSRTLQPRVSEHRGLGRVTRRGMIGVVPSDEVKIQRYPAAQAVMKAAAQVWILTWVTLQSLFNIITGALSLKESFTGPIGIFYITSSVAQQGIVALLNLIAVLSTSIGLFNFLPIPVLDGGHLAFLTVEKLRGKPVSLGAQEAMTRVGLGLLLLLLAVVTYNDLLRFDIGGRLMALFGGGNP